jgi:hypothetical protein
VSEVGFHMEAGGFERGLAVLAERVRFAAPAAVDAGLHELERAAKQAAAVRSGAMRRGVQVSPARPTGAGTFRGAVGPTVIYSRIQDLGGTIYPKRGPYLVFRTADGALIHARKVTIPATHWFTGAVEATRPRLAGVLARVLGEAMRV